MKFHHPINLRKKIVFLFTTIQPSANTREFRRLHQQEESDLGMCHQAQCQRREADLDEWDSRLHASGALAAWQKQLFRLQSRWGILGNPIRVDIRWELNFNILLLCESVTSSRFTRISLSPNRHRMAWQRRSGSRFLRQIIQWSCRREEGERCPRGWHQASA